MIDTRRPLDDRVGLEAAVENLQRELARTVAPFMAAMNRAAIAAERVLSAERNRIMRALARNERNPK